MFLLNKALGGSRHADSRLDVLCAGEREWKNKIPVFVFLCSPVDQDVRYTAVSSFIFLRFFAPAILSPNLFHLRPHHPVSSRLNKDFVCVCSSTNKFMLFCLCRTPPLHGPSPSSPRRSRPWGASPSPNLCVHPLVRATTSPSPSRVFNLLFLIPFCFSGQLQRVLHGCVLRPLQRAEVRGRREEREPLLCFALLCPMFRDQLNDLFVERVFGSEDMVEGFQCINFLNETFPPQFLDLISTSGKWDQRSIETPIMLKEG